MSVLVLSRDIAASCGRSEYWPPSSVIKAGRWAAHMKHQYSHYVRAHCMLCLTPRPPHPCGCHSNPEQPPSPLRFTACVVVYVVSLGIVLGSLLPMGLTPCRIPSLPGTGQPFWREMPVAANYTQVAWELTEVCAQLCLFACDSLCVSVTCLH